ncbi:MAG: nitrate reductase molybdenum cofactor assembly chaperone [Desulfohalobiaceae bacterium]|nr:nitrate reductase molybdenum cofactor assembly chaperone [Desulfohalobiaceae bacterium]
MNRSNRKQMKILSCLLQFPEAGMIEALLPEQALLESAFEGSDRARIREFLQYLARTPLLTVQEAFSGAFDLSPPTCLHLTYHQWGDGQKRSPALARFAEACEAAGFEPRRAELPDYLPLVLELLSQGADNDLQWIISEHRQTVRLLAERLKAAQSSYAELFEVLSTLFEASADGNAGRRS